MGQSNKSTWSEWYKKNKEKKAEYWKKYSEENREKILEQQRERRNKITVCGCGKTVKGCLYQHKKTKYHKLYEKMLNNNNQ
tara:strand:- start:1261 stop:1503 length:243 start_codon:yes stop_codon:yes gene_type:complete